MLLFSGYQPLYRSSCCLTFFFFFLIIYFYISWLTSHLLVHARSVDVHRSRNRNSHINDVGGGARRHPDPSKRRQQQKSLEGLDIIREDGDDYKLFQSVLDSLYSYNNQEEGNESIEHSDSFEDKFNSSPPTLDEISTRKISEAADIDDLLDRSLQSGATPGMFSQPGFPQQTTSAMTSIQQQASRNPLYRILPPPYSPTQTPLQTSIQFQSASSIDQVAPFAPVVQQVEQPQQLQHSLNLEPPPQQQQRPQRYYTTPAGSMMNAPSQIYQGDPPLLPSISSSNFKMPRNSSNRRRQRQIASSFLQYYNALSYPPMLVPPFPDNQLRQSGHPQSSIPQQPVVLRPRQARRMMRNDEHYN